MTPAPWSYSSLDDLNTCPWSYYQKRVVKAFTEPKTAAQTWGEDVHKAFQERQDDRKPLPSALATHETYMSLLERKPGVHFCEQKVGLSKQIGMTAFFGQDVWWRGVIDYYKIDATDPLATLVDYKTGRRHDKIDQLAIFAIYIFSAYPKVNRVDARYYWTQNPLSPTRYVWSRDDQPKLWEPLVPKLKDYVFAYKNDTWQKRPGWKCKGMCPVTTCEHWEPPRPRR